jgi:catechol 2,3-dioxygenase-like lactoylglutathione lyase family enzyme
MIRHISGIAEIVENVDSAVEFYRNTLGLKVGHESGTGYAMIEIPGILHFGVWSREQAAHNIFGENADPTKISLGFMLGFEVDLVEADTRIAEEKGLTFIQTPKKEP